MLGMLLAAVTFAVSFAPSVTPSSAADVPDRCDPDAELDPDPGAEAAAAAFAASNIAKSNGALITIEPRPSARRVFVATRAAASTPGASALSVSRSSARSAASA